MKIVKLACDARGNYRRELGRKLTADGTGTRQHCFYLGSDRGQAAVRSERLERVWDAVELRWQRQKFAAPALWDADTLAIAQAVAKGEQSVRLDHTTGFNGRPIRPEDAKLWLIQLRLDFPFLQIDLVDSEVQDRGQERLEEQAKNHESDLAFIRETGATGQSLHQAFDGFADWTRQHYKADGKTSPTGKVHLYQIAALKRHHIDCPLAALTLPAMEMMIHYWRQRPCRPDGQVYSREHCKDMVKRVNQFFKWLHKSPDFKWRKPVDYEPTAFKIAHTHEELADKVNAAQVETYTIEQLTTLYDYATPLERSFILLALNCGFGAAEVGSVQLAEIHLDKPHGHFDISGSFIKRLRFKSSVYAEWQLWPETVQAIRWTLARRPKTKATTLMVTSRGVPYTATSDSGNRSMRIQNLWNLLRARIAKDFPDFPNLSFNKLRKTGADLIRRASDGETAGTYLAHGRATTSDSLADLFSNRDFPKIFSALAKVREMLAPMFAAKTNPFPKDYKKHNLSISLGTVRQIVALRAAGKLIREIAAELGITDETVRRYLTPEWQDA